MKVLLLITFLLQGCAAFDTPKVDVPFVVLEVNDSINQITYVDDSENYGKEDYWATPKEFYAKGGDCEDYAIAKYFELRKAGVPANRMRLAAGAIDDGDSEHMILIYKETFVLDNIIEKVTPINEYIDFKVKYTFNEDGYYFDGKKVPPNLLFKWGAVIRRMALGG